MVKSVNKKLTKKNNTFLFVVFLISLFLFVLFAYLLYTYKPLLLSPSGDFNNGSGGFLFWAFIVGMLITLVIVAFVLYYFLHESESKYPFIYGFDKTH